MDKVVLYTINCPKCQVLEKKLIAKDIKFETCDNKTIIADILSQTKYEFLPILKINDVYYDYTKAINWLKEK